MHLLYSPVLFVLWPVQVLATVEALDVKRLLFIGVGCQVRPAKPCNVLHNPCLPACSSLAWAARCGESGLGETL